MTHLFTSKDDFGKRLDLLMKETGHTQKTLADKINISRTAISNYISGSRMATADILIKISEVFDVSVDWLLALTNVRDRDEIMKRACAETGLTERSYVALRQIKQEENNAFAAMPPMQRKDSEEQWVSDVMNAERQSSITKKTRGINTLISSGILPDFSQKLVDYLFYYSGEEDKQRQLEAVTGTLTALYDQISNPPGVWNDKAITKYTKSLFVEYAKKVCKRLQKENALYAMDVFIESCSDFLRPYMSAPERTEIIYTLIDSTGLEGHDNEANKKN